MPFLATLQTYKSLSTLLVGAGFASAHVLEHSCGIAGVVVADHTRGVLACPAAAEHQHVGLVRFLPHADELTTRLPRRTTCAVVFHDHTLDHVLTVDASARLGLILDLFVLVGIDVVFRYDVVELAWMKRDAPLGWILMLELERLVEHFPYAWRTDWAAIDIGAGIVVEIFAAYLTVPQGSHLGSVVGCLGAHAI